MGDCRYNSAKRYFRSQKSLELPSFINNEAFSFSSFRAPAQTICCCACAVSLDTENHSSHWLTVSMPAYATLQLADLFTSSGFPVPIGST